MVSCNEVNSERPWKRRGYPELGSLGRRAANRATISHLTDLISNGTLNHLLQANQHRSKESAVDCSARNRPSSEHDVEIILEHAIFATLIHLSHYLTAAASEPRHHEISGGIFAVLTREFIVERKHRINLRELSPKVFDRHQLTHTRLSR
jgi:hypothetical protein